MTSAASRELILAESLGDAGIVITLRMGDDPGPERMANVVEALRVLFDELGDAATIDRQLAHALFLLAFHSERQFNSWGRPDFSGWSRPELAAFDLPALCLAVESVLEGVWVDLLD